MANRWKVQVIVGVAVLVGLAIAAPATAQVHEFERQLAASQGSLHAAGERIAGAQCTTFCSECFWLDTYDANNASGDLIAHSTATLQQGAFYMVTIQGTYSVWSPNIWIGNGQGAVEPAPQFPSSPTTGPVVADWEYVFALYYPTPLSTLPARLPFQAVSLDGGANYQDLVPIGGWAYNSKHVYKFLVEGQGHQAFFKKHDIPTSDNYGEFKICIQKVTLTLCGVVSTTEISPELN